MKIYSNIFLLMIFLISVAIAQENEKISGVDENNVAIKDNNTKYKNKVPINIPLNILEIPKPKYPVRENGTICVTGSIRLRVQFLASGKIGEVMPISNLGYGLTESAVEAARKIKFEPAIRNGEVVTVTKVIVIPFTIY